MKRKPRRVTTASPRKNAPDSTLRNVRASKNRDTKLGVLIAELAVAVAQMEVRVRHLEQRAKRTRA